MPTCHAKAGATPSRIDGIVCNLEAAVLIHSCKVGKDEMTPTQFIVKITVSRNAMKAETGFCKGLAIAKESL